MSTETSLPGSSSDDPAQGDRYALPQLQYNRGTVLIKLGHEKEHWLTVHNHVLSKASPVLRATLSKAWEDTIGLDRIKHPRTGKRVNVKILALKALFEDTSDESDSSDSSGEDLPLDKESFKHNTYFLEGKDVQEFGILSGNLFQDTHWSTGWPRSSISRDLFRGKTVLVITRRAFRTLVAVMYGLELTYEQVAGCNGSFCGRKEEREGTAWLNSTLFDQVVTVCAYAEYLDCLDLIGPAMMNTLRSAPRFWQAVAYKSIEHLMFARKVRDHVVYFDALRHAIAQAYHGVDGVTWDSLASVTSLSVESLQSFYGPQLDELGPCVKHLWDNIYRLQLHPPSERAISRSEPYFLTVMQAKLEVTGQENRAEQHRIFVARSIFGQWLAQQLCVDTTGLVLDRNDRPDRLTRLQAEPEYASVPAGRFNILIMRLEEAAASARPSSIFGLTTASRFASIHKVGKVSQAEDHIDRVLTNLVKQAARWIHIFRCPDFTTASLEASLKSYRPGEWAAYSNQPRNSLEGMQACATIIGSSHFDGHSAGYFTRLRVQYAVPWGDPPSQDLRAIPKEPDADEHCGRWMDVVFRHLQEISDPVDVGTQAPDDTPSPGTVVDIKRSGYPVSAGYVLMLIVGFLVGVLTSFSLGMLFS